MKSKQTVKMALLGIVMLLGISFAVVSPALAASSCGDVDTIIISCTQDGSKGVENSGAWGILITAINILSAGVGILAVAGIVYGAILYTTAGGSQEQLKKAYGIFTNVVIGVLAFALMFALLNFLVPGGLFN